MTQNPTKQKKKKHPTATDTVRLLISHCSYQFILTNIHITKILSGVVHKKCFKK